MVKEDGTVKVLDFGLAKVGAAASASGSDPELSPTISMHATQAGVILGTAAYMAPEQARGKNVDKRADIWAFGVVLYEMVTGRRLFQGEDMTELLAKVIRDEPDLTAVPPQLRAVIASCLEKDPRKRLRDIGDVWKLAGAPPVETPAAVEGRRKWLWPAVAALMLVIAAIGWMRSGSAEPQTPTIALSIVPPVDKPLPEVGALSATPLISPDGSAVLYRAAGGLYARPLDALTQTLAPGSERASNQPCWSADSASVLYPAGGQLMRVRLPDGAPQAIAPLPGFTRGCGTRADGAVLISPSGRLQLLEASGGELQALPLPELEPVRYPEFLPNGKDFLFSSRDSGIYLASLEGGRILNPVRLMENPNQASYTPAGGGRILFVRDDNLYAQALDLDQRKLAGESRLIQEGIGSIASDSENSADFSVSRSGTLAWRPGRAASSRVTTFDREGKVVGTAGPPLVAYTLSLSPDGTRLLATGGRSSLLLDVGQPGSQDLGGKWFSWFPDGSALLGDGVDLSGKLLKRPLAGGEIVDLGTHSLVDDGVIQDVSPDGTQILYAGGRGDQQGLLVRPLGGTPDSGEPRLLAARGDAGIANAKFSPDGRWVVYVQGGLYVQPFPGPGLRRQIAPGGADPLWRGDGREILARAAGGAVSIPVNWVGGEPQFGTPQLLFRDVFRFPVGLFGTATPWAVSRDGSEIYWLQGVEQPGSNVIHVRTNAVQ